MGPRERLRRADWTFWLPAVLSVLAVVATVAALIDPQWIERLFGASPDAGSGESEWWISASTGAVALVSLAVTRARWRAIRPATS